MPDNEAYPSTVFEMRNTFAMGPPAMGTDTTWSALILTLPSPEVPLLYWRWPTSALAPTADMSVVANQPGRAFNTNYNFNGWAADVSRWRRLYGSLTCELNAPALSNQGMVYCAQQRLEIGANPIELSTNLITNVTGQQVVLTTLPTAASLLAQISPGFYKQMAREGCFTVSGLAQPTNLYQTGADVFLTIGTQANLTPAAGGSLAFPIGSRIYNAGGTSLGVCPGVSTNWSSSWVLFTGIDKSSTVELKSIHGYECQAAVGSSFQLFVEPSAEPDSVAVDAYYSLRHGMLDGYPAKFNFLGSLLSFIPAAISKIASWLAPSAPMIGQAIGQGIAGMTPSSSIPTTQQISARVANMAEPVVQRVQRTQQKASKIPVRTKPKQKKKKADQQRRQ